MSINDAGIFNVLDNQIFDECLETIKRAYQSVCDSRDSLREQLSSWNKDEEIQAARRQAEEYRRLSLFQCSEKEMVSIKEFRSRHDQSCKNRDCYQYELTRTSIGTGIKIRCPRCGEEENVTDFDCW